MLSPRKQHCLNAIGIRRWVERPSLAPGAMEEANPVITKAAHLPDLPIPEPGSSEPEVAANGNQAVASLVEAATAPMLLENWQGINQAILQCSACELAQNCTQKVPGIGNREAELLIIGEGPGHDEDIQGEPFVGRSGKLLDKMLAAIGIAREQVFITNIVKCRPPDNRDPKQEEAQQCRAFLDAQIKQVNPRVILCVGRVAAQNLLDTKKPVGKLIQEMHRLPTDSTPVKVTYHPAYLLRTPSAKAIVWQDMKQLYKILHS